MAQYIMEFPLTDDDEISEEIWLKYGWIVTKWAEQHVREKTGGYFNHEHRCSECQSGWYVSGVLTMTSRYRH